MEPKIQAEASEKLATGKEITSLLRKRKLEYIETNVKHALVPEYVDNGWEITRELKFTTRLRKQKSADVYFEDRIWRLFAEMGFPTLNKNRHFNLPYVNGSLLTQQIDVFAADSEIAIVVECKASSTGPRPGNFKKDVEALEGEKEGITASVRELLGNRKIKVVFVFATFDYFLSKPDQQRLEEFNIHHIDNESLIYYEELLKHLGSSARFQLEANLFPGIKIPQIDSRVPAIRGKMGGHVYYAFMIEPSKLLRLGYVLHRSKANKKLMPTYQRLIKKTRLVKVRKFIENGGFFPNSLLVNIENKRPPKFEEADTQVQDTSSRVGVLHLPQKFRSVFIIDGQHRLYGYSDTDFSSKDTIPVVAFHNLHRSDQVRLFMEINENQKAVPKNLRHTLNADLQWDSESQVERLNALKLQIAQDLGEVMSSPLYDRIIVGENTRTQSRTITLDAVKQGLDRGNFFAEFSGSKIKKEGTFYSPDNDEAYSAVFPFLESMLLNTQIRCEAEWERLPSNGGLLTANVGINSLLRIYSDIVDHFVSKGDITPKYQDPEEIADICSAYLDPIAHYFSSMTDEQRTEIRKSYGSGGPTKYWRILQNVIAKAKPDFKPKGLGEYWESESKAFNTRSFEMIRDIEEFLKSDFKERLSVHHGPDWFKKGIPQPVYESSSILAVKKNKEIFDKADEKTPWDCLHIIDYRAIAMYSGNWREIFEKPCTRPGEEKISGGAKEKTKWMVKLNKIRNDTDHEYSVKKDEFEFLEEIHNWVITQ